MDAVPRPLIAQLAERLGLPAPGGDIAEALTAYARMVADWNRRTDLVGPEGGPALAEVLFADALVLAADEQLVPSGATVLDVGAGAGAPLLPLLLLREDLGGVALEPRRRRVAFLRFALGSLPALQGRLQVLEGRLDPERPAPPAPATLAASRATFRPEQWLRIAPALAPEGLLLCSEPPAPWPEATRRLAERRYALPFAGSSRLAVRFAPAGRSVDAPAGAR